jgi:putative flippase GtrA
MIISNAIERGRFLRFAFVGVIGFIVDFGSFNIMTKFLGIHSVIASMISFSLALISNFVWNRYWTYPDSRSKKLANQVAQFGFINLIGLGIRTPLFAWLGPKTVQVFSRLSLPANIPAFMTSTFLGNNIALAFVVGVVMLWNFFANRFYTYSDVAAR